MVDAGNAHFPDTDPARGGPQRARPALRRHRCLRRRGGRAERAVASCPGGRPSPTSRSARSSRTSPRRWTACPCCTHVGSDGAGHFVKMVHNGIEYADMQLIAEAYDLLRQGLGATPAEIGEIFAHWNTGDLRVVPDRDHRRRAAARRRRDRPGRSSTSSWTRPSRRAPAAGPCRTPWTWACPITGIAEATFARALSGPCRSAPPAAPPCRPTRGEWDGQATGTAFIEDVRQALYASKVVAYSQGFDQIAAAAAEYDWAIDRGRHGPHLARRLHHPGPVPRPDHRGVRARSRTCRLLLADPYFTDAVASGLPALAPGGGRCGPERRADARRSPPRSRTTTASAPSGCPPRWCRAQRDLFGAHTYKRVDREGTFHTEWSGDRTEAEA